MFEGYVYKTHDNLSAELVAEATLSAGVHPRLVAAILEEWRGLEAYPVLLDVSIDEGVKFTRARQGSNESSLLWEIITRSSEPPLVKQWEAKGRGLTLTDWSTGDVVRWSHAVWAGGLWLIGSQWQVQQMTIDLTERLQSRGLTWEARSLRMMIRPR